MLFLLHVLECCVLENFLCIFITDHFNMNYKIKEIHLLFIKESRFKKKKKTQLCKTTRISLACIQLCWRLAVESATVQHMWTFKDREHAPCFSLLKAWEYWGLCFQESVLSLWFPAGLPASFNASPGAISAKAKFSRKQIF